MRRWMWVLMALVVSVLALGGDFETAISCGGENGEAGSKELVVGWAIGSDASKTAVILHTDNGGKTWRVQGDKTLWEGYEGNDISCVDAETAWAALGSMDDGKILHTGNGGKKWVEQEIPGGVGPIKQVKGLSRNVAWAVSIGGTVLHTENGGRRWSVVQHGGVPIHQVNRIDAIGAKNSDVWIVDELGGHWGMIHTQDNGETWRREYVWYPSDMNRQGLHMVCAHSRLVAWCATWNLGTLYRTEDGGETWEDVGTISGPNDFDDMCSPTPKTLWVVQNVGGFSGGLIFHVRLKKDGPHVKQFNPTGQHILEGITCSDDQHAVVVGSKTVGADPSLPEGVILATKDGGKTWKNQPVPVDDVAFWKVSFVGGRR